MTWSALWFRFGKSGIFKSVLRLRRPLDAAILTAQHGRDPPRPNDLVTSQLVRRHSNVSFTLVGYKERTRWKATFESKLFPYGPLSKVSYFRKRLSQNRTGTVLERSLLLKATPLCTLLSVSGKYLNWIIVAGPNSTVGEKRQDSRPSGPMISTVSAYIPSRLDPDGSSSSPVIFPALLFDHLYFANNGSTKD